MSAQKQSLPSFASIISVLSIALYCAGFFRLELELNLQKKRINAIENAAEMRQLSTKEDQNLIKLIKDVPGRYTYFQWYNLETGNWYSLETTVGQTSERMFYTRNYVYTSAYTQTVN